MDSFYYVFKEFFIDIFLTSPCYSTDEMFIWGFYCSDCFIFKSLLISVLLGLLGRVSGIILEDDSFVNFWIFFSNVSLLIYDSYLSFFSTTAFYLRYFFWILLIAPFNYSIILSLTFTISLNSQFSSTNLLFSSK